MSNQRDLSYDECRRRGLETCHSQSDGDCVYKGCPQTRDGEPERSGRHCPLDWDRTEDYQ